MTGYLTHAITLHEILEAKPTTIWYSVHTCWWTARPTDLYRHPKMGLPCDPRGGVLLLSRDPQGFIAIAERRAEVYGRHGLLAFEAAHHGNVVVSEADRRPTCFSSWDAYNALIDVTLGVVRS